MKPPLSGVRGPEPLYTDPYRVHWHMDMFASLCIHTDLCICKCVFCIWGYSGGIVCSLEALWEACENAVKMSHCSWHRTGLMDWYTHSTAFVCAQKTEDRKSECHPKTLGILYTMLLHNT